MKRGRETNGGTVGQTGIGSSRKPGGSGVLVLALLGVGAGSFDLQHRLI